MLPEPEEDKVRGAQKRCHLQRFCCEWKERIAEGFADGLVGTLYLKESRSTHGTNVTSDSFAEGKERTCFVDPFSFVPSFVLFSFNKAIHCPEGPISECSPS